MKVIKNRTSTIYKIKLNDDHRYDISIHNYVGCGNELFLSCTELGINQRHLNTANLEEAIVSAKRIINEVLASHRREFDKFLLDDSDVELSIY